MNLMDLEENFIRICLQKQYEVIYIGAPVILGNNFTINDNTIGKIRPYW